jgi:TRAP-type C4-dicarboxylate transport system permease large subunit
MGVVALPEMRKHGYDDSLSCGSIAAGGTLGILIPPAPASSSTASSPVSPSAACSRPVILPGLLLALCIHRRDRGGRTHLAGRAPDMLHFTFKEKLISSRAGAAMIILFVIAIGGIFSGGSRANEAPQSVRWPR